MKNAMGQPRPKGQKKPELKRPDCPFCSGTNTWVQYCHRAKCWLSATLHTHYHCEDCRYRWERRCTPQSRKARKVKHVSN